MEATKTLEPIAVLDPSGKVREWYDRDGAILCWRSQEIGVRRPDIFTPIDATVAPHWAYVGGSQIVGKQRDGFYQFSTEGLTLPDTAIPEAIFYTRSTVVKEWNDTPQGWRAARAYSAPDAMRCVLVGHVLTTHTLERITYESTERSRDGSRPFSTHFKIAVIAWTAILPCPLDHDHSIWVTDCECIPS